MDLAIPSNAGVQIASTTSDAFAGISPAATLAIGLVLAFFIIEVLISLVRSAGNRNAERRDEWDERTLIWSRQFQDWSKMQGFALSKGRYELEKEYSARVAGYKAQFAEVLPPPPEPRGFIRAALDRLRKK